MKTKEIAGMLNNTQYRGDIKEIVKLSKENRMVIITGYSDDNIELSGIIEDEVGAYEKTLFHIDKKGKVLQNFDNFIDNFEGDFDNDTENLLKELYRIYLLNSTIGIEGEFDVNGYSWFIELTNPKELDFAYFDILEDEEKHTRGIVIKL